MTASAYITRKAQKALNRGSFWVYDTEVSSIEGEYENGGILKVRDGKGHVLGLGFINHNSKIRIRLLTRNKKAVIGRDFFRERVRQCIEYRMLVTDLSCCRLVFGEADLLPGLVVDLFGNVLVVSCTALGIEPYKEIILEEICAVLTDLGISIIGIYERSSSKLREQEGLEQISGFIGSEFDAENVPITENGLKYLVDVANGQKTGYFLDQKKNRAAIAKLACGKEVLDCFTHTGSFALNACAGGAKRVTAVDISSSALSRAEKNAELNGFKDKIDFVCGDIFELLPLWIKEGRSYDLVILDPPAFTKTKETVQAAIKGYKEINLRGLRLVRDGGFFATCSCSRFMKEELFRELVAEAAVDTGILLRQIEIRAQSPDHPVIWGSDESYYLKFFVFQVLRNSYL